MNDPQLHVYIVEADFDNPRHQADLVAMLDDYAQDLMGGGRPLPDDVKARLIPGLKAHPAAYSFLAYRGDPNADGEAIGLANCFMGFSTFAGKPLINIHDISVTKSARRMGVGRKLLDAVTDKAQALGCCYVTLEVRDDNPPRRSYTQITASTTKASPTASGSSRFKVGGWRIVWMHPDVCSVRGDGALKPRLLQRHRAYVLTFAPVTTRPLPQLIELLEYPINQR